MKTSIRLNNHKSVLRIKIPYKIKTKRTIEGIKEYFMTDTQLLLVSIIGMILVALCTFRPLHSSDTFGYYNLYLDSIKNANPFVEQSYQVISRMGCSFFGIERGFRFLLFIYASIAMLILICLMNYCEDKLMSFLTWFSFAYAMQMLVQIRSAVANIIFILSLQDIIRGNWKKYYIKTFIAISFHNQAIVFLVIYPIARVILRHRKALRYLPVFALVVPYIAKRSIESITGYFFNSGYAYLASKTDVYVNKYYTNVVTNPLNRISLALLAIVGFELLIVGINKLRDDEIVYITVALISVFCYFLGYFTIPIIALRYPECFNLVMIMILPLIGKRWLKGQKAYKVLAGLYLLLICNQYSTFTMIVNNIINM